MVREEEVGRLEGVGFEEGRGQVGEGFSAGGGGAAGGEVADGCRDGWKPFGVGW